MNPSEVSDELTDDAVDAWHDAPRDEHGNRPLLDDLMRHILAAVLPVHEAQVRERVATEIMQAAPRFNPDCLNSNCPGCIRRTQAKRDARIARGGS